jgi:hypothetical protein
VACNINMIKIILDDSRVINNNMAMLVKTLLITLINLTLLVTDFSYD